MDFYLSPDDNKRSAYRNINNHTSHNYVISILSEPSLHHQSYQIGSKSIVSKSLDHCAEGTSASSDALNSTNSLCLLS